MTSPSTSPPSSPSTSPPTSPLTVLAPLPPARRLPADYPRHQPTVAAQRAVLTALVDDLDPASLGWAELVEALLVLGRTDVPLARLAEGHLDAVRILGQAGAEPVARALYGVWASRSQQTGLRAEPVGADGLRIDGTLRFASGAGLLDRALVPVWLADGRHLLVDLDVTGLPVDATVWRSGAMQASRTHELRVAELAVPAGAQVGEPDFYLRRPGFFPGGVGVAACWVGGAARVVDLLRDRHPQPSPTQQSRFGRIRTDLVAAAATVRAAGQVLDDPPGGLDRQLLATEARAVAAEAVRRILHEARLLTGPAGLALDDGIAHAVPDLEMYTLQQNSDGDAALLGDPGRQP